MRGFLRGTSALVALLLGAFGAGCTEEETELYILANVAREPPDCLARAEADTIILGTGFLDVALALDYDASLLVGNQMTPRGDKANLRTEAAVATITGAEVQLLDDQGALTTEFTVPATGVIRPDGSDDPGLGIINVALIPASAGEELFFDPVLQSSRNAVLTRVAQVSVFGETIGGVEVESAVMTYVIKVCRGCLVSFPTEAVNAEGNCVLGGDRAPAGTCRFGQDEAVDCRLCAGENPFCQTAGPVTL